MRLRGCRSWSSLGTDSHESTESTPKADCTADRDFWAKVWNLQAIEKTAAAAAAAISPTAACNGVYPVRGNTNSEELTNTSPSPDAVVFASRLNSSDITTKTSIPVIQQPPSVHSTVSIRPSSISGAKTDPNDLTQLTVQCRQPVAGCSFVFGGARRAILAKSISVDSRLTSQRVVAINSGPYTSTAFLPQQTPSCHSTVSPIVSENPLYNSAMSSPSISASGSSSGLSPLASVMMETQGQRRNSPPKSSTSPMAVLPQWNAAVERSVPEHPLRSAFKSGRSFECHTTLDKRANRGYQGTRTIIKSVSYDSTVELDDGCTARLKFDANRNYIDITNKDDHGNNNKNNNNNNNNNSHYCNNNNNIVTSPGYHFEATSTHWARYDSSVDNLSRSVLTTIGDSGVVFNGTYPIDEPIKVEHSSEHRTYGRSRVLGQSMRDDKGRPSSSDIFGSLSSFRELQSAPVTSY